MTGRLARTATLVALLAAATAAQAEIDVELRNGDRVTATIASGTEVAIVRFRVPKGAVVTVKAAAKKRLQIRLRLEDTAGSPLASAEGRTAVIARQTAPASGLYSVEIASRDGVTTGDCTLAVTWRSPTSFVGTPTVPSAGTQDVAFSADAGATATFSVKAGKKSLAAPTLAGWTPPDASFETLSGTSQKRTLGATGDGVLTVASVAGGVVAARVRIRPPAASRQRYSFTSSAVGGAGVAAVSMFVGSGGGAFTLTGGQAGIPLDGAAISVPAGALPIGTAIVIGTAPGIATSGTQAGAGPTVFFGPEGLQFGTAAAPNPATLTIPFDPSFSNVTDQLTILTRDAKGVVTPVAKPYTFDLLADTVSFEQTDSGDHQPVAGGDGLLDPHDALRDRDCTARFAAEADWVRAL